MLLCNDDKNKYAGCFMFDDDDEVEHRINGAIIIKIIANVKCLDMKNLITSTVIHVVLATWQKIKQQTWKSLCNFVVAALWHFNITPRITYSGSNSGLDIQVTTSWLTV